MNRTTHDTPAPLPRKIESRDDFGVALVEAVHGALTRGTRRMVWADTKLADWPLEAPELLQPLTDWLREPQRRLILLAEDFDDVRRRCPRFVALYRLWSHAISAFTPPPDGAVGLPSALLAEAAVVVHLMDPIQPRGWSSTDKAQIRQWRDRLDAILQRSEPSFPVTTLGL